MKNPNSEKVIEKRLNDEVAKQGGWSIKLPAVYIAGLPDRMILLPDGIIFFVEVKSTGRKPTKIQLHIHERIKRLGFEVYVVDKLDQVYELLNRQLE